MGKKIVHHLKKNAQGTETVNLNAFVSRDIQGTRVAMKVILASACHARILERHKVLMF